MVSKAFTLCVCLSISMANSDHSSSLDLPRVLIVSRRAVRKNKFIDFVGEYHLDLILRYGAVPVIVPRASKIHSLLQSFEPFHGVLFCEGEDIDPSLYDAEPSRLSPEELDHIRKLHPGDTSIDKDKDSIELKLAKVCLESDIPCLGICRGSQILNVSCGGTLYQDVEKEISHGLPEFQRVVHINYENYDEHRHLIKVMENCPLHVWFNDSMRDGRMEIMVNSYHHQGVKKLAQRFVPMAFSPDGLVEGFYDRNAYDPEEGRFVVGLQFHPERMRHPAGTDDFDYPGCPKVYQEFVKAVIANQKRLSCSPFVPRAPKFAEESELKRRVIPKSLSVGRNVYKSGCEEVANRHSQLEGRPNFLQANTALSLQQENRLEQVGARNVTENMSLEQLSELVSFHHLMGEICSEALEQKLNELLLQEGT